MDDVTDSTNAQFPEAEIARRIIAESTLDAVVYADRSGTIRLWNHAAETMFGHRPDEAVGRSLDLIVPERQRDAHWRGWDRVMESGTTRYGTAPLTAPGVRKDGSRISLEFSIVMLKDPDGRVEGVAAVLRDVTERWNADRERRRLIREYEQRLAGRAEQSGS
ncbi:PAS domain S-box protein [Corynebacterium sp.]|jgi:PAS domain S-box-containing protein|uniref:PAS domain-containing protein n=1 Tax=Corynebacterium sp. TaxID=1720 RepID=UPI0025C00231|nr:PAS domain S-box protein [Corynebacterium sp.]